MLSRFQRLLVLFGLVVFYPVQSVALQQDIPSVEEKTASMQEIEGYFNVFWDDATGKLFWEIDKWNTEFLYAVSMASGLGSNPVGIDRGQLGGSYVLTATRVGPKVLLVEPNYRYRALSDNPEEVEAVREAFAPSTHWGFDVAAQTGDRVLVDATDFFIRDVRGIARTFQRTRQGTYRLDKSRSVFHMEGVKGFPKNTEIETSLTFTSDEPGRLVSQTAASGEAVTLRVHHSLVELPDDNYEPRVADPRVGSFGITFYDYATPIDEPLAVNWISRHRLEKRNPNAQMSEPVEPIVYYLDRGTPEPVRSALIEGGNWWNQAFEAAGFIDGFRVELLPEGADPQDIRYNMIHWTHRSTRGWSYGGNVTDPRTGEIIKGNVNLGSLRLRQDVLLSTPMAPPFGSWDMGYGEAASSLENYQGCDMCSGPTFDYLSTVAGAPEQTEMALARVRQLSAHEIGHTLGFSHNYIASTYADRASVMDYPAPRILITNGQLDLSDAYGVGIGEYDKFAVKWAYSDFPDGTDEATALGEIVRDGLDRNIRFLADQDARPAGGAHPLAGLWDNGSDPIANLRHEMEVRRIALGQFSERVIREGAPMAQLEEVLVPLFLHHRYQVEAAAKSIAGVDYTYALRGDGQVPNQIVSPARQRDALASVLETVSPEALALPEGIISMIPPRAFGMNSGEVFQKGTSPSFDPLGAAASAADISLSFVFQSQRMARLVEFNARNDDNPSLEEVVDEVLDATWKRSSPRNRYQSEVLRTVQRVVLDKMIEEAGSDGNTPAVRAVLSSKLGELADWLAAQGDASPHQQMALDDVRRWQVRAEGLLPATAAPTAPEGSPIGSGNRNR